MIFLDFKSHFQHFQVFSIQDILKWDAGFDFRRLVEWQRKNYIRKIINRWYLFTDAPVDENFLFLLSNRIYSPSYVSFESALAYYQFIPEGVYTITAASTLKTHRFNTSLANFSYRQVKQELMFGYKLIEVNGQRYKIAEPEKLILDYLYLNTTLQSGIDFISLRINHAEFWTQVNEDRLIKYLALFENKSLEKRVNTFLKTFKYA